MIEHGGYLYFVGSSEIDLSKHKLVKELEEILPSGFGYLFRNYDDTSIAKSMEASLRKIDRCEALVAIADEKGDYDIWTKWEIAYALHNEVCVLAAAINSNDVSQIYDISEVVD